ncbi:MAG: hypothetical protein F6K65_22495 [Moorea sp. SIO3C2]|nr:hypothetical protein [Moorena sp. SIO3C2]
MDQDSRVEQERQSETTSVKPEEVTYTQKTERIQAFTQLIKSVAPLIWTVVIIIVFIPLVSKLIIPHSTNPAQIIPSTEPTVVIEPRPDFSKVNQAVADAVKQSHASAEAFAAQELDSWEAELIPRVDSFLDWYFDYFNQKKIELSVPFMWGASAIMHQINPNLPSGKQAIDAKLTETFQKEFSKRVIVPQNAQMRMELITNDTIELYMADLGNNLSDIQSQYQIPQGQWDRYINEISTTINDTEGNLSNISLKLLIGGSGYLVAKPILISMGGKVASKVSSKLAGKAASKMAAKTGGLVATELGASIIDPLAGIGLLIWDVWDYRHTLKVEKPILRSNILGYLKQVKKSLLNNPETGIMTAIYQLEDGILQSVESTT